jgi:hypothetical protein
MGVRYHSDDSAVPLEDLPSYATVRPVSPGFFTSLRIPVIRGAYPVGLTGDEEGEVVLVNQALALSLWPDGETPVGRTVWLPFGSETPARIAGMTEDFAQNALDGDAGPEIFVPWELWTPAQMYMMVRTSREPESVIPGVRAAIWSLDEDIPISYVRSMAEVVSRTTADSRLTTLLLSVFGALALILGAVGVYGVASCTVSQSTFEIGLRMALGAGRAGVLVGIMKRFLFLAGAGILLGTGLTLAGGQVLSSILYHVSPRDPSTLLGVALTLGLTTMLAVLAPALRASRVQPGQVLKKE